MGYKACNELLGEVAASCSSVPSGSLVRVPWLTDAGLNGAGRVGAIVAIENGLLGLARNDSGKFKLYYNANNAGNWVYEIWSVWKAGAALLLIALLGACCFAFRDTGLGVAGMLIIGLISIPAFGGRAFHLGSHWAVAATAGHASYFSGIVPSAVGVASGIGFLVASGVLIAGGSLGQPSHLEGIGYIWSVTGAAITVGQIALCYSLIIFGSKAIWALVLGIPTMMAVVERAGQCKNYSQHAYEAAVNAGLGKAFADGGKSGNSFLFVVFFGCLLLLGLWPLIFKS